MNYNGVILWFLLVLTGVTLSKATDCYHGSTASYTGTWNITRNGETCQRWDSQTPHEHGWYKMKFFPMDAAMGLNLSDINNYCRDTESDGTFWCFTINPSRKWDYCDVPRCPITPNSTQNVANSTETTVVGTSISLNETGATQGSDKIAANLFIISQNIISFAVLQILIN